MSSKKAVSKKAWPHLTLKQRQGLYKDIIQFNEDCEKGLVPSGGWCDCCERYDCGCYHAFLVGRETALTPVHKLPKRN